ncbi:ABC transporter ATP-binding protein [Paracoccus suum]|uniref:ABC transporter ATP-binding protein n=1 Tax=Paracoccus suum TaxID=2259340 RepID=UPI001F540BA9|nr:ABC transporter ATP-binding protein [Paracoccus suum]
MKGGIVACDVGKRFGRTLALDKVSLTVQPGQLFALLGPNGAGKTTLVRILTTLLRADSGTVLVDGKDVVKQAQAARASIGVVFQEPSLDDRLTVGENLDFHGRVYGVPGPLRRKRIHQMLDLVELTDQHDRLVRTLSSGMKRRVEIARALIHDTAILFMDEPTVGLDVQSRARIWDYIARLRDERDLTVVVTTHYIEEVAGCDRVCIIDQGKVLAADTPAALRRRYGQVLLRVTPRDEETRAQILALVPDAALDSQGSIILPVPEEGFVDRFLARFGPHIITMHLDEATLESVFLSLTGREIRERAPSPRERTYAFAQQGGEHTR